MIENVNLFFYLFVYFFGAVSAVPSHSYHGEVAMQENMTGNCE